MEISSILDLSEKAINIAKQLEPDMFIEYSCGCRLVINHNNIYVELSNYDDNDLYLIHLDPEDLLNTIEQTIEKYRLLAEEAEKKRLYEAKKIEESYEKMRLKINERDEYERLKAKYETNGIDNGLHKYN